MRENPDNKKRVTYGLDFGNTDFRAHPERYRVGKGEQGVLLVEPYKSEILPHWRFATPEAARESSEKIFGLFENYLKQGDFVGADMARKFLQMGYTRSRRYANHKGGKKYDGPVPEDKKGQSGAHGRAELPRTAEDPQKAEATWDVTPSALLVSDGKTYTQYGYKRKEYRQNAPLPDGKSFGLVDVSPLVDFFDVAKSWYNRERELARSGELRSLTLVGKEKWDGIDCTIVEMTYSPDRTFSDAILDRLAGAEPIESCRFYIGPNNLIHRLVEGGNCRAVSDRKFHNLAVNPPLKQAEFAYTLPADARPRAAPPPPLAAGKIAPDFTALGETGPIKLSDFKGKIVVLDFWATWCQPCQKAMPHLRAVYDKVQGKNVVFLGICVWDERKPYDTWVTRRKEQYPFVFGFDPAGRDSASSIATSLYRVSGIPTTFVIDEKGVIAASFVDYRENDTRLETALAKLGVSLAATPAAAAPGTKTVTLAPKGNHK